MHLSCLHRNSTVIRVPVAIAPRMRILLRCRPRPLVAWSDASLWLLEIDFVPSNSPCNFWLLARSMSSSNSLDEKHAGLESSTEAQSMPVPARLYNAEDEKRLYRKVDLRIMPILALLYLLSYDPAPPRARADSGAVSVRLITHSIGSAGSLELCWIAGALGRC